MFDAALARAPLERDPFLVDACEGDETLLHEVSSLLHSSNHAQGYFDDLAHRAGIDGTNELDGTATPEGVGSLIGGYEIRRLLGRGGMATVYSAHDPKHDREVALKVLDPAVGAALGAERFLREIRLAARLQHLHILPVFDSGESAGRLWFTMPYVVGGSLRERLRGQRELSVTDAMRLVRGVALALDEAHRRGIVHRDVKPENILLTTEGDPLLADFGIACPLSDDAPSLTQAGVLLGTPTYMSPEQSDGNSVIDGRSDLYSLGCVFYEMLAGEPPFTGPTPRSIIAKRLACPAPDIAIVRDTVPAPVREVLARVLSRNPADRYQSGAEFARAIELAMPGSSRTGRAHDGIRRVARTAFMVLGATTIVVVAALGTMWLRPTSGGTTESPSPTIGPPRLAVLPFKNLGAPEDVYFTQGITDEITSHLATLPGLRVISRTSTDRYADSEKSIGEIGRELGVSYVLEGSVRWEPPMAENSSGHVRVTPQLIRVVDDTHLWVGHYQAETIVGVLDVQTTVARHVAKALDVAIEDDQHLSGFPSAARTTDPVAYTLYLKGRHFWSQRTGASLPVAIDYLEQAIARDSQFAAAYAALAHAHVVQPLYTNAAPAEAWRAAREAAETALMLDSTLSEAHAALGFGLTAYEWQWAEADSSFRRAIALNPNDATTRNWYSALLGITGRVDETVAEARRATELDPFSSVVGSDFGWLLYSMGRYDEAIEQLERTIGLDSLFAPAYATLACVYLKRGELERAVLEAERAVTLSDRDAERLGILSRVLATAGRRAEADAILVELEQRADREYVPPTAIATAYLGRDDRKNALRWLAKAVDQRDAVFVLDHQDPLYDPIRFDPDFTALLQRMGLGNLRGSERR